MPYDLSYTPDTSDATNRPAHALYNDALYMCKNYDDPSNRFPVRFKWLIFIEFRN